MSRTKRSEAAFYPESPDEWDIVYTDRDKPSNLPEESEEALSMVDSVEVDFYDTNDMAMGYARVNKTMSSDSCNPREIISDLHTQAVQLNNVREFFSSMGYDVEEKGRRLMPEEVYELGETYESRGEFFNPDYTRLDEETLDLLEEEGAVRDLTDLETGEKIWCNSPEGKEVFERLEEEDLAVESGENTYKIKKDLETMKKFYNGRVYQIDPQMTSILEMDNI